VEAKCGLGKQSRVESSSAADSAGVADAARAPTCDATDTHEGEGEAIRAVSQPVDSRVDDRMYKRVIRSCASVSPQVFHCATIRGLNIKPAA
jgi:hypothetical protein